MDQESGAAAGGSFIITLNENEQRYYSGLHNVCQADSSGKLHAAKVAELLKSSQLPPEALHQITEVCGAKRLGYFGAPQFYVALKLLAAAQCGLPICLENVSANLPLPRFVGLKNEPELRLSTTLPTGLDAQGQQGGATAAVSQPWTPGERSAFRHPEGHMEKKEPRPPPQSPGSSPPCSPSTYHSFPYAVQRNGTDSQIAPESKHSTRPVVQLEQPHSSPSKYGTKQIREHSTLPRVLSAERLDRQGVADHPDDDPWRITEEQRDYYTKQFRTLQPDLGALILGTVAKNFFTKSKLPIPELSHIWELSDVDRDGALTFSEFCTAFHLIVARKNGFSLPESLPASLQPGFLEQEADTPDTPESTEPLIVFEDAEPRSRRQDRSIVERLNPALHTSPQELKAESSKQDFSLKKDVASQDKYTLQGGAAERRPEPPLDLDPTMKTRTRPRSYSSTSIDDAMKKAEEPPTPPPRPQKSHSRASSLDLNKLFQQGAPGVKSGWLPPPPALPPRPPTTQVPCFLGTPEKTTPKKLQQPNFADFSRFREEEESDVIHGKLSLLNRDRPSTAEPTNTAKQDKIGVSQSRAPQKPVRRKYHPDPQNPETTPPPPTAPAKPAPKLSRQKREIQMAIRKNREANAVLTRLNSELQQQLKVVHQDRISLESQLDVLRPLAST